MAITSMGITCMANLISNNVCLSKTSIPSEITTLVQHGLNNWSDIARITWANTNSFSRKEEV